MTDSIQNLAQGKCFSVRWFDLIARRHVEDKSAKEIISDLMERGAFTIESTGPGSEDQLQGRGEQPD